MSFYLAVCATILTAVSAALGFKAATVEIRDNLDEFINDLRRQGRWAMLAGIAAALAACAQAAQLLS